MRILEHEDARWQHFLETARPTLFQGRNWTSAIVRTYGYRPRVLAVLRDGAVRGGLPFAEVDDFRGLRRIAFPFSDVCEPLGIALPEIEPWLCADDAPWSLRSRCAPGSAAGDAAATGVHHHVPLPGTFAQLEERFHAKQRHDYRQAIVAGLRYDRTSLDAGCEEFYHLFSLVKQHKHRRLPQGLTLFTTIAQIFGAAGGFIAFARQGSRAVGAMLFLAEGSTLHFAFGGSALDALAARPNHFLLAQAMNEAIDLGYRTVDLGLSNTEGLIRFKERLGGVAATVYRASYGRCPEKTNAVAQMESALRELTQALTDPALPLEVPQRAGELLYRYFL